MVCKQLPTLLLSRVFQNMTEKKFPQVIYIHIANQKLSAKAFADYLEKRSNMVVTKNPKYYIDTSIESILSDDIMNYENSVLEKKYPDFRYLMLEFHDGILLFDISVKKSMEQSTGRFSRIV